MKDKFVGAVDHINYGCETMRRGWYTGYMEWNYVRANNGLESFNRYLKEDCTRHVLRRKMD